MHADVSDLFLPRASRTAASLGSLSRSPHCPLSQEEDRVQFEDRSSDEWSHLQPSFMTVLGMVPLDEPNCSFMLVSSLLADTGPCLPAY